MLQAGKVVPSGAMSTSMALTMRPSRSARAFSPSPLRVEALKFTATEPLMVVSWVTSMVYMALEAVELAVKVSCQLLRSTPLAA